MTPLEHWHGVQGKARVGMQWLGVVGHGSAWQSWLGEVEA